MSLQWRVRLAEHGGALTFLPNNSVGGGATLNDYLLHLLRPTNGNSWIPNRTGRSLGDETVPGGGVRA